MRWVALAWWGCVPAEPEPTPPPPTPECPSFAPFEVRGTVPTPPAVEISGVAVGDGRIWVHNDSGEGPEVHELAPDGAHVATWTLAGVVARDFEDMACGPGPDGEPWLYVGDIGDNARVRPSVTVHRFPEPASSAGGLVDAEAIELVYPDGPRDAETLLVDPADGALIVVDKVADGQVGVYRLADPAPGTHALERVATLVFGAPPLGQSTLVTGGDLGPRGLVLRTYLTAAFVWPAAPGDALAEILERGPCPVELAPERQGEAIGWAPDGLLTISEGVEPAVHFVPLEDP